MATTAQELYRFIEETAVQLDDMGRFGVLPYGSKEEHDVASKASAFWDLLDYIDREYPDQFEHAYHHPPKNTPKES